MIIYQHGGSEKSQVRLTERYMLSSLENICFFHFISFKQQQYTHIYKKCTFLQHK